MDMYEVVVESHASERTIHVSSEGARGDGSSHHSNWASFRKRLLQTGQLTSVLGLCNVSKRLLHILGCSSNILEIVQ